MDTTVELILNPSARRRTRGQREEGGKEQWAGVSEGDMKWMHEFGLTMYKISCFISLWKSTKISFLWHFGYQIKIVHTVHNL